MRRVGVAGAGLAALSYMHGSQQQGGRVPHTSAPGAASWSLASSSALLAGMSQRLAQAARSLLPSFHAQEFPVADELNTNNLRDITKLSKQQIRQEWDRIGKTPLVKIQSLSDATGCTILAKAEYANPSGSHTDRTAQYLIIKAQQELNSLPPDGDDPHIIEATRGNLGISMALWCKGWDYRCMIFAPDTVSAAKIERMRQLGAQVRVTPGQVPESDPRHYFTAARLTADSSPKSVFTNQFENLENFKSHYSGTADELWYQTDGGIDGFVCTAGTGGTIAGVSVYLKEKNPDINVYLVDSQGSGISDGLRTGLFRPNSPPSKICEGSGLLKGCSNLSMAIIDGSFNASDQEVVAMMEHLRKYDGLEVGPTSALNAIGAVKLARRLGSDKMIVTVMCDSAELYADTSANPQWLAKNNLATGHKSQGPTDLSFVQE